MPQIIKYGKQSNNERIDALSLLDVVAELMVVGSRASGVLKLGWQRLWCSGSSSLKCQKNTCLVYLNTRGYIWCNTSLEDQCDNVLESTLKTIILRFYLAHFASIIWGPPLCQTLSLGLPMGRIRQCPKNFPVRWNYGFLRLCFIMFQFYITEFFVVGQFLAPRTWKEDRILKMFVTFLCLQKLLEFTCGVFHLMK